MRYLIIFLIFVMGCFAQIGKDATQCIKNNGEIQSINNIGMDGALCDVWSIIFTDNNFQVKNNFHKDSCYKIQITNNKRQMTVAEMNQYLKNYGRFNKTEERNVFISIDKKIRVIYKDNKLTIEDTFLTQPELSKTIQKLETK